MITLIRMLILSLFIPQVVAAAPPQTPIENCKAYQNLTPNFMEGASPKTGELIPYFMEQACDMLVNQKAYKKIPQEVVPYAALALVAGYNQETINILQQWENAQDNSALEKSRQEQTESLEDCRKAQQHIMRKLLEGIYR